MLTGTTKWNRPISNALVPPVLFFCFDKSECLLPEAVLHNLIELYNIRKDTFWRRLKKLVFCCICCEWDLQVCTALSGFQRGRGIWLNRTSKSKQSYFLEEQVFTHIMYIVLKVRYDKSGCFRGLCPKCKHFVLQRAQTYTDLRTPSIWKEPVLLLHCHALQDVKVNVITDLWKFFSVIGWN